MVDFQTEMPAVPVTPEFKPTTMKYVLNEEAAKKYWATAKFEKATVAPVPAPEPMTEAPLPPQDEPAPVNPYTPPADVPMPIEEKPVEEKPMEKAPVEEPVTTPKYVLNEEAAKKYWATAKFPETTAAPVPPPEPMTEAPLPPQDEPAPVNPYAPPADVPMPIEEKPVEEKPVEKLPVEEKPVEKVPVEEKPVEKAPVEEPVTTPKYVLNEEAAKKYWATAKFPKPTTAAPVAAPEPTTAAPVVAPEPTTKAAPVEVPAKDEPVHVGYGLPVQPEEPMPIPADEPVSKPMGY
ncbi:hypothetical protein ANCDUO_05460 [Ancylostoma duodenale]|uniref:Uncharacterized protein n=1 Tax=Ancylostoma duodenale TaxID=51022 RepID=A0A0C2H489_9BILA|nr:hypothetical protein ANCDUO_05460 [Ancylostoma duodenale]